MDAHTHLRGTGTGNAEARQFAPNPIGPRVAHEAIQFLLPWSLPTITGGQPAAAQFFHRLHRQFVKVEVFSLIVRVDDSGDLMLRRTYCRLIGGSASIWRSLALAAAPLLDSTRLQALAVAVLPASLGKTRVDTIANQFEVWVAGYRPGAEMEHGYGVTRMAVKSASPLATYKSQLAAFGPGFESLSLPARQQAVKDSIAAANITALPQAPTGQHIATDLMAFWFRSAEATDFCYQRSIRRYDCRGFQSAGQQPPPLKG